MSTLDRYIGVRGIQSCSDSIISYHKGLSLASGILAILFGFFSFGLGIAAICVGSSASYIGYGIWCGFIFIVAGVIYIVVAFKKNACLITVALVFSLTGIFCSIIQFSLGVFGTYVDANRATYHLKWTYGGFAYDIFNTKNVFAGTFCTGNSWYNFDNWAPVDILLLIGAFIELIFHFIVFVISSLALCCGVRYISFYNPNMYNNRGYSQSSGNLYPTQPPIYKVTH
ncbi:hypothetical protein HELRODRAFT_194166 [Helobdella robusta]|uniref:Uncharacterized protein n=1 Tax=Helobdella robusta TaxID=6412 RepID=T1FVR8_HELRO|nr:hypothetical protein HELRODRAFT_194166 [Helobdella robusta]ESN93257.1 hypothetical protein HELRODRAFT_194166 [Helobdella robusta]